ncbi:transposable element Tcb2 transposase [Trichonephila clavipes]|nr:transposable element Tcb2 transposase [Trichonephila clavipes]
MEAGWSGRRVARHFGRSDCVVRRCWDQWIREMSFTRRLDSGWPRQTSHREDRHILIDTLSSPTAVEAQDDNQVYRCTGQSRPIIATQFRKIIQSEHKALAKSPILQCTELN